MEKYSAPAITKMLDIIELLSKEKRPLSLNDMAKLTGIPLNSVFRICLELEKRRYLVKNEETGAYSLGIGFYYIGIAASERISLLKAAKPYMDELRDICGETVHLCQYNEKRLIILDQSETKKDIRFFVQTGSSLVPHASAFGKNILAFLDDATVESYLSQPLEKLTPTTVCDSTELKKELIQIKENNIAYDLEEYIEGINCVGSAVFDRNGNVTASVGIVGLKYRMQTKPSDDDKAVLNTAMKISREIGCPEHILSQHYKL